ncbi:unnamed protein product [Citrullus colocynthis]|uniref:Uncharacterized protein n=1 Tax=Citrullus colocynthis TaxID=252529 RepID=A0ABP0Y794_9ROSI
MGEPKMVIYLRPFDSTSFPLSPSPISLPFVSIFSSPSPHRLQLCSLTVDLPTAALSVHSVDLPPSLSSTSLSFSAF